MFEPIKITVVNTDGGGRFYDMDFLGWILLDGKCGHFIDEYCWTEMQLLGKALFIKKMFSVGFPYCYNMLN